MIDVLKVFYNRHTKCILEVYHCEISDETNLTTLTIWVPSSVSLRQLVDLPFENVFPSLLFLLFSPFPPYYTTKKDEKLIFFETMCEKYTISC